MRSNIHWSRPDVGVLALIVIVGAASASMGAARLLWIGGFSGAGNPVRAVGFVLGVAAGLASWRALESRSDLGALVATVATVSLVASLPTTIDQTSHLIRLYGGLTSAQADRYAEKQVPSATPAVFDQLKAAIPPGDTYVVHGDVPFQTWTHYWLLPRVAVTTRQQANWVVFHGGRRPSAPGVRRLDASTWLERVER